MDASKAPWPPAGTSMETSKNTGYTCMFRVRRSENDPASFSLRRRRVLSSVEKSAEVHQETRYCEGGPPKWAV